MRGEQGARSSGEVARGGESEGRVGAGVARGGGGEDREIVGGENDEKG